MAKESYQVERISEGCRHLYIARSLCAFSISHYSLQYDTYILFLRILVTEITLIYYNFVNDDRISTKLSSIALQTMIYIIAI